jgi:hypothetical protein
MNQKLLVQDLPAGVQGCYSEVRHVWRYSLFTSWHRPEGKEVTMHTPSTLHAHVDRSPYHGSQYSR